MVINRIRMLRIPVEWYEFEFKGFRSLSNGSNLNFNALNPFRMVRICIRMLRIPIEWLKFAFDCFEFLSNGSNMHSNGSNLHSNASNPFQMV